MAYLFEPPTNVTTSTQMVEWVNTSTASWLFQGILSSVFIISLVSMLKNPSNTASKSFAASAFITMILSIFARVLKLIPTTFMTIWIILVGLSSIWMYIEGTQ